MGWTILLGAALLVPPGATRDEGVLGPITVVTPRGGPRVVYRRMMQPPLAALRLSVPVEEAPGLRGATRVLQELQRGRLEAEAARIGARVELEYTPGYAVYSIVGPEDGLDAMVGLLRRAATWPAPSRRAVEGARVKVEREALAALELPGARVRIGLRAEIFPSLSEPPDGHLPDRLHPADLEWFWRRYYLPERMTVVVVAGAPLEAALSALGAWQAPPPPSESPPGAAPNELASPPAEAVAAWAGVGWPADGEDPAVLAVASRLVAGRLAASGLRAATAELWWGLDRLGFVAVGSAAPGSAGTSPAAALRAAIEAAADRVDAQAVTDARRSLWHAILIEARTPHGLAALIGRFMERTGEPEAAPRFLDALLRVDAARVRSALLSLVHRPPALVEVRP